jgi:hypothetical protein
MAPAGGAGDAIFEVIYAENGRERLCRVDIGRSEPGKHMF